MLTLDEPDSPTEGGRGVPYTTWPGGDVLPLEHLFMTVRVSCDHPPSGLAARDPDPLYLTHGDPRD